MLATVSRVNTAVAKQLAKKYLKTIEQKLSTTSIVGSSPQLIDKIKSDLDDLERDIEDVNSNYSHIDYA